MLSILRVSAKALVVVTLAPLCLAEAKAPEGTYRIDPVHSKVGFEVAHLVVSSVEGKFNIYDGFFKVAPQFNASSVGISIDVSSIDTGAVKRDNHLRSSDFFDAKKYPQMKFESTKIAGSPESFAITGKLTIHGVTKEVALNARFLGSVKDKEGQERVAFSASTKISRKAFGLTWNETVEAGPVVGDVVSIDLKVQAVKAASDAKLAAGEGL